MPNHPSVVARRTTSGFAGRYVHNDGQPALRVPLLLHLHAGPFAGDVDAMARFLIDDHPAGWSQLGLDPHVDTGWINPYPPIGDDGFRCYCHGDRHDPPELITEQEADPDWHEWTYMLTPQCLEIWESSHGTYFPRLGLPWITDGDQPHTTNKEA
jgi:hypothetical protein